MAVVYRHIRLDTNEVFYIGVGKDKKRPYVKTTGRSKWWKNIITKTEYEVQVLKDDLPYEDAWELETMLIEYYGRKDLGLGPLVNLNNGGNGQYGFKMSKESIEKSRLKNLGKIPWNKGKKGTQKTSDETKKLLSEKLKDKGNKKIIDTSTGKIYQSLKECCEINGFSKQTLSRYLRGDRPNKTNFEFYEKDNTK